MFSWTMLWRGSSVVSLHGSMLTGRKTPAFSPSQPPICRRCPEIEFASLKTEHVHPVRYRTRAEAAVFEYLGSFYNRQRLHSGLGHRTPTEARASMEEVTVRAAA